MKFVWDSIKAKTNKAKHGMAFVDAQRFDFDTSMDFEDDSEDYGERRFVSVGFIDNRISYLVYTRRRGGTVRVISLRPATKQEAKDYVAYIERGY